MDGVSGLMKASKGINIGIYVLFLIGFSLQVTAFGVTAPYWKENPLIMNPGDTREITFTLQNMVGEEDMRVSVEVLERQEYVQLLGPTEYEVPAKTKDVPVKVQIAVPQELPLGTIFPVRVSFRSTEKGGTRQVQLGTAVEKTFDVIVGQVEVPKEESPLLKKPATPALIVLVIVVIAWLLLKKLKKKETKDGQNAQW
jgi:hypothetical protein